VKKYRTPDNLIELLDNVVKASSRTSFYSSRMNGVKSIASLDDFLRLPVTSLPEYRAQRLADVLADSSRVQWIVGAYRGQEPSSVAVAEGAEESVNRFDLLTDAVKGQLPDLEGKSCAIVTSPQRRYFAAETGTILIHAGIPSHVFVDRGAERTYERLRLVRPDILVILSDELNENALPSGIELCITFRQSHRLTRYPQLDIYLVDEPGFLGQSTDCRNYTLNRDMYYFETSAAGNLVVTSLYNRVQPILRIETLDRVERLTGSSLEFAMLNKLP
jgi:hypothetical protein